MSTKKKATSSKPRSPAKAASKAPKSRAPSAAILAADLETAHQRCSALEGEVYTLKQRVAALVALANALQPLPSGAADELAALNEIAD